MTHRKLAGVVLPLLVVAAGALLLGNTLGLLPWHIWSHVGRLWPILVVVVGLTALLRNVQRP
jgi:hypothetical protein